MNKEEKRRITEDWKAAREEALRKYRTGELHHLNFPEHFRISRNKTKGWGNPVPVLGITNGTRCDRLFHEFLPVSEIVAVPPQDVGALINRIFSGTMPDYKCLLAENWRFGEIEDDVKKRVGHEFEGRRHGSIVEIILKALYDLERSLYRFHPKASCAAAAGFWTSWNLQRHLAEFAIRVQKSPVARSSSFDPERTVRAAREQLEIHLAVYAHEINPHPIAPTSRTTPEGCTRRAEVDAFLEKCNEHSSVRILRRHIWLSVGHRKGRQFEYWQACDEKEATHADKDNFGRILRDGPQRFLEILQRQSLIPKG